MLFVIGFLLLLLVLLTPGGGILLGGIISLVFRLALFLGAGVLVLVVLGVLVGAVAR